MNNKMIRAFFLALVLVCANSFAETFKIPLNTFDQSQLTNEMAKIDYKYKTEEVINENTPSWYVLKKYNYLNDSQAFYINCSEEFHGGSPVGTNKKCEVGFDYALSSVDSLNVHNGFMEIFAIAEIKDQTLARDLYKTLGNGVSPTINFFSKEQLSFTHPTAGNKFSVFRLIIECKRDNSYKNFACTVYSVK
jgi:hypothetical protein